ncbi:restriction endonuclease subunit S [Leuconostoc lactis]|uniref:restriction endonuclease subunit S n=1 Tax=Leuconostoc lactis TaxID=1246 RepID=UPI0015F417FB|nr:restriction endonuclease subunit S [Leuconostoc lactis]MBA5814224.1 restriction endonuclease subunit S [Leuconostoc lactis]
MSNKVPQIRFNGYSDAWEERKLGDLIEEKWIVRQSDGNHGNLYPRSEEFVDSGVPYVAASNISSDGNSIDFSTVKYLPQSRADLFKKGVAFDGDILLAHNATVGPALRLHTSFDKVILSTTLTLYRVDSEKIDPDFFLQNLRSSKFQNQLFETMKQSTRNQVPILTQQKLSISITSNLDEQERIGKLLTLLDDLIAANQRKLDLLKEQKKGYLQKMFPKNGAKVPELRFAGFADDWEERKFKDILKTYSFRSYLANASDNGKYEVIQQGDNPLVGYSDGIPFMDYKDIILFGDHTVSLYKPQSPFFISTDGVKILSADNFEGNYLYTTLERYKPDSQGYKRHFTILKNQELWFTRNVEEQQKVGSFFKQLDNNIALQQKKLSLLKDQKKGLLQKMFI